MKACPYCAEQIQDAAVVCRFCGRDLPGHESPPPASPPRRMPEDGQGPSVGLIALLGGAVLLTLLAVLVISMRGGDAPAPAAAAVTPADPASALVPGQWTTERVASPDGATSTLAMVASNDAVPGASARPALALRCGDAGVDLYVTWFVGLGAAVTVATQLDDGPSRPGPWSVSTDQQSTFFDGDTAAMLGEWRQGRRLVAEVTAPAQGALTASFDVSGLDAVLAAMPAGCG